MARPAKCRKAACAQTRRRDWAANDSQKRILSAWWIEFLSTRRLGAHSSRRELIEFARRAVAAKHPGHGGDYIVRRLLNPTRSHRVRRASTYKRAPLIIPFFQFILILKSLYIFILI